MAILYPDYDTITKLRQKPTEGELHLINFLMETLSDEYEIFFQPFLNGDMPDIVIMKKRSGVYIIEVKDWNLDLYSLNDRNRWFVKTTNGDFQPVQSPVTQVFRYKQNLYNLHVKGLLERKIKNPKMLAVVNCGVYFHNSTTEESNSLIRKNFTKGEIDSSSDNYLRFLKYFDLFGRSSLTESFFMTIMRRRRMEAESRLFDDSLYEKFKRVLQPPTHLIEQGKSIRYTSDQQKVINSSLGNRQKVKGVAGSGKTMCLAKRAVNAYIRHGKDVLILTFNISLRNYIRDKISEVREEFPWKHFHIIHYHEFFKSQVNNCGLKVEGLESWNNEYFFEDVENKIQKYDTVIIDEVQDYQEAWINIINKYFLAENGEYVVFGDEKQNIYQIIYNQEEKKPYTKIGGAWNVLKESFRVSNDIARLAEAFQKEFFTDRYELDEILIQRDFFEASQIRYIRFDTFDEIKILKVIRDIIEEFGVHDNDICIQASNIDCLRSLDYTIRTTSSQKTNTMFETLEIYDKLYDDYGLKNEQNKNRRERKLKAFKKAIEKVRRNKKFNFWNNPGTLKLSTIHSFKGWEVNTLFLLIDEDITTTLRIGDQGATEMEEHLQFTTEELIYTAITRCRNNLVIMNFTDNEYHRFFIKQEFDTEHY
jgi:thymidine kinase